MDHSFSMSTVKRSINWSESSLLQSANTLLRAAAMDLAEDDIVQTDSGDFPLRHVHQPCTGEEPHILRLPPARSLLQDFDLHTVYTFGRKKPAHGPVRVLLPELSPGRLSGPRGVYHRCLPGLFQHLGSVKPDVLLMLVQADRHAAASFCRISENCPLLLRGRAGHQRAHFPLRGLNVNIRKGRNPGNDKIEVFQTRSEQPQLSFIFGPLQP